MKKNITILLLALLSPVLVCAQTIITGKVLDSRDKQPLTGANVYVVNTDNRSLGGCIVDLNGTYRLQVPDQKNLRITFSFIGYKSKVVDYTGQRTLDVLLEEAGQQLSALEVTATRVERNAQGISAREMVGAVQKVTLENLETSMVTNITEALQGTMANVDILTGADPGSGTYIRIRGTSSLSASSEPLFVVDGVPLPVDVSADFNFATANSDDYSQLLNIPPSDIESIEVLKDAAATAVWGSKGANGVLLITTKKGTKGRLSFSFNSKNELKKEGNPIPMLNANQYVSMIQDAIWNTVNDIGQGDDLANTYLSLLYNTKEIGFDPAWINFDEYNQDVNWLDLITQPGFSFDNNFSVSGGGDKTDYRVSLGLLNEEGTTIGTAFQRFSTTFNMRYKFSDRLDISTNYGFTNGKRDASYASSVRSQSLTRMPNMSPYRIGDDGKFTDEYFTPYTYFQGNYTNQGMYNPVAMVHESVNQTNSMTSRMIFNLHYRLIKGLDYYGVVGFDARTNKTRRFLPQSVTGESYINKNAGLSSDGGSDNLYLTTENRLIYNKLFNEDHKLLVSAILQTSDQTSSSYFSSTSGNSGAGLSDPVIGSTTKNAAGGSGRVVYRSIGGVLNAHYTLKNRYMFNAGYRLEASSSMAPDSRWGGFPTLGVAWQLGDEPFMKELPQVSVAKIRINWGQSGNSPSGSAPYVGAFSAIPNGYGEMPAIQPIRINLSNLRYELISQSNLGIDVGLFDNKLNVTVDLYDKLTSDMLQRNVTLPGSTGFTSVTYYNSGKMSNKGWEFRTDVEALRTKKWRLSFDFNIANNQNEILELPDNKKEAAYTFGNRRYAYKFVEGDPLGSFYGYKYTGVYQNVEETYAHDVSGNLIYDINGKPVVMKNGSDKVFPGDARYADINGDGVIDQYDIVYIGNSNPILTGGFGFNLMYNNLGIVASFHGRAGQKVINQVRMDNEFMYGKDNQSVAVLRRWRNEGDETDIPRALYNKGYNNLGSDRYIEDASFLRLKTLTLKYDFKKEALRRLHITKLQLYVTGYDLLTLNNYKGQDPEISLSWAEGVYPVFIDKASTPKPLRVAFGLNVTL